MQDDLEPFVRICRNDKCRLVTRPDPRIYKDAGARCPKCGTPYEVDEDGGSGHGDNGQTE